MKRLSAAQAQPSLKATLPSEIPYGGEIHKVLEVKIVREFWLVKEEENVHAQMVDTKSDLTWGHLRNLDMDAHMQFVSTEPNP